MNRRIEESSNPKGLRFESANGNVLVLDRRRRNFCFNC